jgi:hypothetical protein
MNTQITRAAGRHSSSGKIAGLLLTSAMAATFATPAYAKGVRAGSIVTNTATATYDVGPTTTTINSNTVSMRIDEVLDVTVASRDANDAGVAADAKAQVRTFTVTNAGNGPEAFNLSALAVNGNAFNPAVTIVAIDTNGDGIYEAGTDLLVANGNAGPVLEPDASYTVLVLSDIPATAADASRGEVRLSALAVTGVTPWSERRVQMRMPRAASLSPRRQSYLLKARPWSIHSVARAACPALRSPITWSRQSPAVSASPMCMSETQFPMARPISRAA